MKGPPETWDGSVRMDRLGFGEHLALTGVFAGAALRYWLVVFPRVGRELRHWRRRAARIPDPQLRRSALAALGKRGNMEGAAAFAAFVPRRRRAAAVRALVACQAIYNHADMLAEQPSAEPADNAHDLHGALLVALDPHAAHRDYYAHNPQPGDGGYLAEIVDACRAALGELPAYRPAARPARRLAARIVAFQSLSIDGRGKLEDWARTRLSPDDDLEWWETAAAAGSSLGVHALIAAAAAPAVHAEELAAIENAYFPWIGALHSLLDSLIDEAEDAVTGQLSLIRCCPPTQDAAMRLCWLAARALGAARALPDGRRHTVLIAAMACSYLSTPEASGPSADALRVVRTVVGPLAGPMLLIFRLRRLVGRTTRRRAVVLAATPTPAAVCLGEGGRGVDAGAA